MVELYERMLLQKKEMIDKLEQLIKEKIMLKTEDI